MEFDPSNHIVKICLQGMASEKDDPEHASRLFLKAWQDAIDDFEKFLAAYFVAGSREHVADRLQWYQTALQCALKSNSKSAESAYGSLYSNIARCYEDMGEPDKAEMNRELSDSCKDKISDTGPFYHGTRADLQVGDMLTAGRNSNYQPDLVMNHIYFTALPNGAGLAAALAKGEGKERVYIVEPTGSFENDPNVTDKKFPGNLTRSYRTDMPLKIVGEATDWVRQAAEQVRQWREKLDNSKGEIIN